MIADQQGPRGERAERRRHPRIDQLVERRPWRVAGDADPAGLRDQIGNRRVFQVRDAPGPVDCRHGPLPQAGIEPPAHGGDHRGADARYDLQQQHQGAPGAQRLHRAVSGQGGEPGMDRRRQRRHEGAQRHHLQRRQAYADDQQNARDRRAPAAGPHGHTQTARDGSVPGIVQPDERRFQSGPPRRAPASARSLACAGRRGQTSETRLVSRRLYGPAPEGRTTSPSCFTLRTATGARARCLDG